MKLAYLGDADVQTAIEDYFAAQSASQPVETDYQELDEEDDYENAEADPIMSDNQNQNQPEGDTPAGQRTGGTTLSGQPAEPLPAGWGRPAASRFGRIEDLARDSGRPARDDSDDEEDERKGETTYAGGERRCVSSPAGLDRADMLAVWR